MKSLGKLSLVVLSLSLFAGNAHAAKAKYQGQWGMAGCGLGSLVIKNHSKGPQIGAWFLNMVGYQTFAITSGTSNCVKDGSMAAIENEQEVFVGVNLSDLQKEAARGQGEHLDVLAEIFGCDSKEGFAQLSQNRYEAIFTKENPSAVVESYKSEIKSGKVACTRAG